MALVELQVMVKGKLRSLFVEASKAIKAAEGKIEILKFYKYFNNM